MSTIQPLLNQAQSDDSTTSTAGNTSPMSTPTPTNSALNSPTMSISTQVLDNDPRGRKKQKICKDAAIFKPGQIRGECRYPPDEYQDELLEAKHQMYEVYPIGDIATFPRHIPYNSEKKLFWERTGRQSFEGD
jgi:hypothetical protein